MSSYYFKYNNVKYPSGTIFSVRGMHTTSNQCSYITFGLKKNINIEAVFLEKTENGYCKYRVNEKNYFVTEKQFSELIIDVVGQTMEVQQLQTVEVNKKNHYSEMSDNTLFLGWIWYVFIMIIASIFRDRIGIWLLASVVFFTARHDRLKKG